MIEALVWFGLAALVVFTAATILACLVAASRADDRADRLGYEMAVQRAQERVEGLALRAAHWHEKDEVR